MREATFISFPKLSTLLGTKVTARMIKHWHSSGKYPANINGYNVLLQAEGNRLYLRCDNGLESYSTYSTVIEQDNVKNTYLLIDEDQVQQALSIYQETLSKPQVRMFSSMINKLLRMYVNGDLTIDWSLDYKSPQTRRFCSFNKMLLNQALSQNAAERDIYITDTQIGKLCRALVYSYICKYGQSEKTA